MVFFLQVYPIFTSVTLCFAVPRVKFNSHCKPTFPNVTLFTRFDQFVNYFCQFWPLFYQVTPSFLSLTDCSNCNLSCPSATHFPNVIHISTQSVFLEWLIFESVSYFFPSVTILSNCKPFSSSINNFLNVIKFPFVSKRGPFFQMWPIFLRVKHFSGCDPFVYV